MKLLTNKHIVLGITGSIAAYKSTTLASMLTKAGAKVDVVMTASAAKLVAPLTFQSVTGRRVYVDDDLWQGGSHVLHIDLGQKNDAFLIAPATANTIAKLAHGLADNLLAVTALASRTPLLVAPAMDGGMYANPATQANLRILAERGMTIIGPAAGHLASGLSGKGRMVEPEELFGRLRMVLGADGPLSGRKVVVTAGGTREPIDPVRVITNRSSGKQGYALAQAALDLGAAVTLISAPTCLAAPFGAALLNVTTADEMLTAVMGAVEDADVLIMAAAVADFKPAEQADEKIKKADGVPTLTLEPTPDVLGAVAALPQSRPRLMVGFAAESQNLLENAQSKLSAKQLDLIVANDISAPQAGFDVDTNRVTLLRADGEKRDLPLMSKAEVAERVLGVVVDLLEDL
ncbi:MAG: bifunctional 4'-phosphopantothenoylcysteine decarboxylase/phosphopantothenoylcysteine synthetase [Anaerolineaceae bacterium 4572_5.1]|nr:MAG: bifunctional 4'-phosphopantothenoylcysteine decarboxylase/phosphopantothenoylcysteine synthetase [Anaerolineaceae bacterium 4572_5.1]